MARLRRPATLDEAIAMLADAPGSQPIAGGVGISLSVALGRTAPDELVAVGHLADLRRVERDGPDALIGAGVTISTLATGGPDVPALLAAAAADVANPGIREVGTLGGNLIAGGPTSDLLAALLALGASLEGAGSGATIGALDAPVPSGAVVRAIRIPGDAVGWGWQRLTIRGAMDRSCASVAAAVGPGGWRIALTAAPSRATRLPTAEAAAADGPAHVRDAAAADLEAVGLRDDDRASVAYRRRVIPVLVERAVRAAQLA